MKKIILLLLVFIHINAFAQAPFIQWQKSFGGSAGDAAYDIIATSDSGYMALILTSSTDGNVTNNHGGQDCWLVKLTAWGDIVWQKTYGGSGSDVPTAIHQTSDGGYIFIAYSNSTDGDVTGNHGDFDYWVVKVDDTGRIQWEKSYGGSGTDIGMSIEQTTGGGYIVAGWTKSNDGDVTGNHGAQDYWVVKLNDTGGQVWKKCYGGSDVDQVSCIKQTSGGGYIISGQSASIDGDVTGNHGGDDYWIVKINDTGSIVWEKSYGGSQNDDAGDDAFPGAVQQTFDGGYIISGWTDSPDGDVTGFHGGSLFDYWVVKLDDTGRLVWEKTLGGTQDDDGYFVRQTFDSGYIVAGTSSSVDGDVTGNLGTYDYWIVKLNKAGSIVWQQSYGGTLDDYAFRILPTSDSEFIVGGYSASNNVDVSGNHGGYDAWIVKLGYCTLPTVGVISGLSIVCAGSQITLNESTPGGTWSVGNTSYATISGGGVVTGISGGSETILYSVTNSCGTGGATAVITISQPKPVITKAGDTLSTATGYNTYQWTFNGTIIPGATNTTYITNNVHGVYSVTVTNSHGCIGTSGADTVGLGVNTLNNNTAISIIPNPTVGAVYIKGSGNVNIKVYNIMGQLLKEADNTDNISISELPAGLYLIRLYDEQGILVRQEKIIRE